MHSIARQSALALVLLALPIAAYADLVGSVVKIQDGDSLTVLVGKRQVKVRLTEIDTPERGQPFGTRARESLSELCAGKEARVVDKGKDRYGRTLGRVYCASVDTSAEQVRRGMAWVFDRFVTDRSLYTLQDEAKAARRGLWADAKPVPPWEWRRLKDRGEAK
mgnify:CR=1 FL=1